MGCRKAAHTSYLCTLIIQNRKVNINILPDPIKCADVPGGVNSVVFDHALGFLAAGYSINDGAGPVITHALSTAEHIDVYHNHGLYPIGKGHFDNSYTRANSIVLQNALRAKVTVCISEFSANILRHHLHIDPHVTRNGIWIKDYARGGNADGPILFPKASLDANARADDAIHLRDHFDMLSIAKIPGIKSTGPLDRKSFLKTMRSCSIYLGTTKENNSMATMEAMIMGVPVVGYDYGFNHEWLNNGVGCELVPAGDQCALENAVEKVLENWKAYSKAARDYAEIFDWKPVINELLSIYQRAYWSDQKRSVSIIIPCHNYAKYLEEAIRSALNQTIKCEVIVVDDKSTDDTAAIAGKFGKQIIFISNDENLGVAETRNKGIRAAKGAYIICLDADDKLYPDFAEKHLSAFKSNQDAIAYATINLIDDKGNHRNQHLFRSDANPAQHAIGRNQIPSCCMFRKVWWRKAGGYDAHFTPAEDANLWLKMFSLGGLAVRASKESMMDYRIHMNSLSAQGFPDWWKDTPSLYNMVVRERDPKITIVIDPVIDAKVKETLWSIEHQDYPNWACQLQEPAALDFQQTFPWLNKSASRQGTVLHIKAGSVLSPNFLSSYMAQTPEWVRVPRAMSL